VEYAVTNNILVKAEFLYMQANANASSPIALVGGTVSETATIKDSIICFGINYKYP
jgi:opacity protein-like surface antigen